VAAIIKPGVLITRPADQIEEVSSLLEQQGAHAVPFPLLDIVPISLENLPAQTILPVDRYALSIFISGNAVRFGVPCLMGFWHELPEHMQWVGVGRRTADEMARHGMVGSFPELASSEGVLSMPETQQISRKRVLIIRGQGGREMLSTGLRQRGAQVDYLEVYRREKHPWTHAQLMKLLTEEHIKAVIVTSGEALTYFDELIGKDRTGRNLTLLLPSARLVDSARQLGFDQIRRTEGADSQSMVTGFSSWLAERQQHT